MTQKRNDDANRVQLVRALLLRRGRHFERDQVHVELATDIAGTRRAASCLPAEIEHGIITRETMNVEDANPTLAEWMRATSQEAEA